MIVYQKQIIILEEKMELIPINDSKLKIMLISESYPREFDLVGLSGLGKGHSKKKPLYVKLI